MAEYWVSKKQYWCKYCDIWVRDDAPSKRLHEGGMKHQGSKERFIRNLYKGGERAKRDKEAEARTMERIEALAARASHSANDGGSYSGRPITDRPIASSSKPKRDKPSGDKWSNYSSAAQLGIPTEEEPSSYEIEQMIRGRGTKVGQWEEVVETPTPPPVDGEGVGEGEGVAVEMTEEEEAAAFKFHHRDKRPVRDVYGDDDVDTGVLMGLKLKSKERKVGEGDVKGESTEEGGKGGKGFSKGGWGAAKDEVKDEEGVKAEVDVKAEPTDGGDGVKSEPIEEKKPDLDTVPAPPAAVEPAPAPAGSMFKKRRPPPSSRKK